MKLMGILSQKLPFCKFTWQNCWVLIFTLPVCQETQIIWAFIYLLEKKISTKRVFFLFLIIGTFQPKGRGFTNTIFFSLFIGEIIILRYYCTLKKVKMSGPPLQRIGTSFIYRRKRSSNPSLHKSDVFFSFFGQKFFQI